MKKVLLSFAVLFMAATGVPIMAQDTQPEYEISIPEGDLTTSGKMEEGKRYLISDAYENLCKPMEDGDVIRISSSYEFPVCAGTQLDESFFWTVEVPENSEDGRIAVKHIQSNMYIAVLKYGEMCTMTSDIAAAALFEASANGNLLQPDAEGGLGLYCMESGVFAAGWDETNECPKYTDFAYYDVDANNIIREKEPEPVKVPREVTLTLPQHNGEDVIVKAQYYDGDKVEISNLPYFGCFSATGFAERTRTVSETNCAFTVKGTWDEPVYTSADRIFAIGIADDNGYSDYWVTYNGSTFTARDSYSGTTQWAVPADRKYIWYFTNVRFDNESGNYLVTLSNAMAPAGIGLTSDADGNLSFTDTPTEFILSKTYPKYGSDTEHPRTSLVYCVDGKKMSFEGSSKLKTLINWEYGVDMDDTYPGLFVIVEPEDDSFDNLTTFTVQGMTFNINAAKREAAKASRTPEDYRAMFELSPVNQAKVRYAELAGFAYGSASSAVKLPGHADVNDPILVALAKAIEDYDDAAAEAALAAAENVVVSASTEYTEGLMFHLKNWTEYMILDSSDPTKLTYSREEDSSDALKFTIVNVRGKKYIYCPDKGKFLSATGKQLVADFSNSWTLSDAKHATPVDFICLKADADIVMTDYYKYLSHNADIVVAGSDPILYCAFSYNQETKKSEIVVRTSQGWADDFVGVWTFSPTGEAMAETDLAAVRERFSPKGAAISMYYNLAGGLFYNSGYKEMTMPGFPDLSNPKLVALADAINAADDEAMEAAMAALDGTTWLEPCDDMTEGLVFGLSAQSYPDPIAEGEGTETNPYNPTQVIGLNSPGTSAWVKGYIVGVYDYDQGSVFVPGSSTTVKNCIAISTTPDAADGTVIPVQIDYCTQLNLADHPEYYKRVVAVNGKLQQYFGVPAVKEVYQYFGCNSTPDASRPVAVDSSTGKLTLSDSYTQKAKFAVVKHDGKNYIYNLDTQKFVNAFAFSPQSYGTGDVPTAVSFGVNNTGGAVAPWRKNHGVDIIGGRIVDSEEAAEGTFGWSDLVAGESVNVKAYNGWQGSLQLSLANELTVLDEEQLAELRAKIAAAREKVNDDLTKKVESTGDLVSVNSPTKESVLAVANDESLSPDYLAWYMENNMFECHQPTHGSVYKIICVGSLYKQPADSETDAYLNAADFELLAFAVEGTRCVLRTSSEDDSAFNWLCNIGEDGSISFVHYVPTETKQRESELTAVYLSLPAEHLGAHADAAEPQTAFPMYRNLVSKGSGVVALPVANYSDASKTVWLPNLWIYKVSDDATDAGASTSITEIESAASTADEYFDMSGRRVAKPAAGRIYIVRNGAKTAKRIF